MAILDFLKKRQKGQRKKTAAPEESKKKAKSELRVKRETRGKPSEKETEKLTETPAAISELKQGGLEKTLEKKFPDAYRILKSAAITEKATDLSKIDQYVFKVSQRANKTEIKKAIQSVYGVDALGVRIINVGRKKRMKQRQIGWRPGYKKAIVRIKKGQKIEILPH